MRPFLTLHDPQLAQAYYEEGTWKTDTFYSLMADHARQTPNGLALRDGKQQITWANLKTRVDAFAAELRDLGLVAGDRVSIWMSNKAEGVIAFLACSRQGYACNPSLHKTYTCGEIIELLTRLNTRVLITEDGWGADRAEKDFAAMTAELPSLVKTYTPSDLPQSGASDDGTIWGNPDSVAYLAFTSGTTGKPKCVMHSCNTLLSNARDLVGEWSVDQDAVILTLSPISHHIAWVAVGQWLIAGCALVLDDPAPGVSRLDWILEVDATYVLGVPTHAMDILQERQKRGLSDLGNVKTFYMAGAPIPDVVAETFVELGIKPQNVYGMTENSSHQFTRPEDSRDIWISTCGKSGKGYTVALFDAEDEDKQVGPGVIGQIGGRGANLMLGYFDNQTATSGSFNKDGWFLSGDLGEMDEEGNLKIKGRLKDLIIRGGHNIYPSQIEALAARSDDIQIAAAFPVPDDRLGEKVCLAIRGKLNAEQMLEHLYAAGLSKFDMPEYFIALEEFPLTASGKILKRALEQQVADGTLKPEPVRFKTKGA